MYNNIIYIVQYQLYITPYQLYIVTWHKLYVVILRFLPSPTDSMDDEPSFSNVEKPGEKRLQEMKELYGEGATRIFAMETAMQLSFQKCYDQKAPKLWPTLPLNIKFN